MTDAARGEDQLFIVPQKLTQRQQLIYDYARRPCDAREAGTLLHISNNCRYCRPDNPCKYATTNGREILEALRRKGLLKRDRYHVYRRADSTTPLATSQQNGDLIDWGGF
jgi:hypothetical protein